MEYGSAVLLDCGYAKVRYLGLEKDTANPEKLFALCNLWMPRKRFLSNLNERAKNPE